MARHGIGVALAALVCQPSHAEAPQGGPFPTGLPTYAQVASKLLPPAASSGRESVTRKYVDAGPALLGGFLTYRAQAAGDYLEQEVEIGSDGRYEVVLWLPKGPTCGLFIVAVDNERLGPELDGYAAEAQGPEPTEIGEQDLTAGTHRVKLLCTGRNPESQGHELWIDAYVVRPEPKGQFVNDWQVAGPFPGDGMKAEAPPKDAVWQPATAEQGVLDFGRQLGQKDNAAAWARATIRSPQAQETTLWVGSDDGVAVWLNGEKVNEYTRERPALPDQDQVSVKLRRGENQLLCRVNNVKLGWQLIVRPQDSNGELTVVVPEMPRPQPADLAQLGARVKGFVVWESNRAGQWQLYRVNTDGSGFRQLSDFPQSPLAYDSYLRPQVSPDGNTILFAYGNKRKPAEVWTMPSAGGEARKLTAGLPLNWSPDGREVYFIHDNQLWRHVVNTGGESLVSQATLAASGREGGTVGTLGPDLQSVALRSPERNEYVVLGREAPVKTMGGCQARLTDDGRYVYWVQNPKDFRVWEIGANNERQLLGEPAGKWNYTYFPTVSADDRWLAYGGSPGQHDHDTSDYEIYLQELRNWQPIGPPVRLSFSPKTDRWPYLWIER
jgi:hypothetical protein